MAPPNAPSVNWATGLNGVCVVQWTPDPTGAPATSFTVTSNAGDYVTVPGTSLTAVLSALTMYSNIANGTPYTFSVTATNGDGTSPPSSPSLVVTPNVMPGPLGNLFSAWLAQFWADGNVVECWFGEKWVGATTSPNRIVWFPGGGPIKQTMHAAPGHLRTVHEMVSMACWGQFPPTGDTNRDTVANYDAAYILRNNAIASWNKCNVGSWAARQSKWAPGTKANTPLGAALVSTIELWIPITEYPQTYSAPLQDLPQTTTVQAPGIPAG